MAKNIGTIGEGGGLLVHGPVSRNGEGVIHV